MLDPDRSRPAPAYCALILARYVGAERIEQRLELRIDLPGRHIGIGRQLLLILRQSVLQHWRLRLRVAAAEQIRRVVADRASIRIA